LARSWRGSLLILIVNDAQSFTFSPRPLALGSGCEADCMSFFCLIHGGAHGPEGWTLLAGELEQRGHRVLSAALPLNEPDASATRYAAAIAEQVNARDDKSARTILLAHSVSGLFLPLAAELCLPAHMVFLAALVPRPGVSMKEQFRADPSMFSPAWVGANPREDEVALRFLFHDCPQTRLAWALSTRAFFYPRRAMEEPCPLETWPTVPASYIACSDDRTISPAWQRRAAREYLRIEPVEFSGGHCPQACRPDALAAVLDEICSAG
jgi:Alpha/beta hydrolase family